MHSLEQNSATAANFHCTEMPEYVATAYGGWDHAIVVDHNGVECFPCVLN